MLGFRRPRAEGGVIISVVRSSAVSRLDLVRVGVRVGVRVEVRVGVRVEVRVRVRANPKPKPNPNPNPNPSVSLLACRSHSSGVGSSPSTRLL